MKSLLVIEHQGSIASLSNAKVAQAARCFSDCYDALVIGQDVRAVAEQVATFVGCETVWLADQAVYKYQLPENTAALIATLAADYQAILAPASTFGKNLMPRVAGLLDVHCVTDVIAIHGTSQMVRPMYAGHIHAVVECTDPMKVLTVRPANFSAVPMQGPDCATIRVVDKVIEHAQSVHVLSRSDHDPEQVDLTSAKVVVSGGRGLKGAENFSMIKALAEVLGAAIGATRAAVDAGYITNDKQVGQTGQVVAPELYIAVGISGAVQHVAGIQDSRIIVAINQDPKAPIFRVADYGLVGDLFTIVPELIETLDALK